MAHDSNRKGLHNSWEGMKHSAAALVKVGLLIVVPSVVGAFIGTWLEPQTERTWSVLLGLGGFIIGCILAWRAMHVEMRHHDELERRNGRHGE